MLLTINRQYEIIFEMLGPKWDMLCSTPYLGGCIQLLHDYVVLHSTTRVFQVVLMLEVLSQASSQKQLIIDTLVLYSNALA
jgi:hypothetical protein